MTTSVSESSHPVFMNWDGKPIDTPSERTTLYLSLVQMVKSVQAFGRSLEDKSVSFLEQIKLESETDVDSFLFDLVPSSLPESSRVFVESVSVLISVPHQHIALAALELVQHIFDHSSWSTLLILVQNGLITKVITSLNIFSLSFTEAEMIHTSLLIVFLDTFFHLTSETLNVYGTICPDKQQKHRETFHNCIFLPFISHPRLLFLCPNQSDHLSTQPVQRRFHSLSCATCEQRQIRDGYGFQSKTRFAMLGTHNPHAA
ncbi:hypothetical protein BLNAU_14237 [Blattamonas nauphoetae]|uniref:Uncharacterized protein n=1 Tax=Blattamonas nauphoetae TaxID=2049346 RepID=A0ABQ9XHC6_9EUKA|nr:hypothetical protein BLNAU_14237 [Blattamonas nauphoetae]